MLFGRHEVGIWHRGTIFYGVPLKKSVMSINQRQIDKSETIEDHDPIHSKCNGPIEWGTAAGVIRMK